MRPATIIEVFMPVSTRVHRGLLVLVGTLFLALCAQITIPLPFTPVPLTGQTFAVLLTAILLGSQMAVASIGLYLFGGAVGLPIFAGAGGGLAHLIGPTGGYLWGFLLAAHVVGRLAERGWDRRLGSCLLAMLIGEALIYLPGLLWLYHFVPLEQLLRLGLLPFIPGDLIKIALVTTALPIGWKLIDKEGKLS